METVNIYENKYNKISDKDIKKVSVIIPNYNYANFLVERIDSILRQTYPIHELIILDDKSTDNSLEVIKEKIKDIKVPVKLIVNEKNSGSVFSQWQKGLENVTGDYFWIAEADDSCHAKFLETVMQGFLDKDTVLSYCDSLRINEKNEIIAYDCHDLYDIIHNGKWDNDYINDGKKEIEEGLSILNTIINVSGVVWKMGDYHDIFEDAKNYHVAGDWFIYYNLLKNGKVAFFKSCFNYYRKHGSSVSTDVLADTEYQEIVKIQEMANKELNLGMEVYRMQRFRRSLMDKNVSSSVHKKRIAWLIPHPGKGSGGHRTIIQNVNALIKHGYECDIYVEDDLISTNEMVLKKINDYYGTCAANVYVGMYFREEYDLMFLTGWQTIKFAKALKCKRKAYFIQDFEPCFFPMGVSYLLTENSYRYSYMPVTIGKWLSNKMITEYNCKSQYFDFCADLNVYKPLNLEKEKAICYIYQPEKERRCDIIALEALKLVKAKDPEIKIYLFGSNTKNEVPFEALKLGIIPIDECNKLYNKCQVGLCMSATNPSRIPFEMMASGLPVVELYKENNLYDFKDDAISLAIPTPEAIATALLELINNPRKCQEMSKKGIEYMKDYPLEKGFEKFVEITDCMLNDNYEKEIDITKSYQKKPIEASKEMLELAKEVLKCDIIIDTRGKHYRLLRRIKRKIKDKMKGLLFRISNLIEKM